MSLNMSNEVAKLLGGIIFNEECEIQIADEKSKHGHRREIYKRSSRKQRLQEELQDTSR